MRITFIANFGASGYDEKNIATSLERLGHTVQRIHERGLAQQMINVIDTPDIVLWLKLNNPQADLIVEHCNSKYVTVCWVFDLYFGYPREYRLNSPCFEAQYVFTTDGGHQKEFQEKGINHNIVRQGIFSDECYLLPSQPVNEVIFVGSDNPYYQERSKIMDKVARKYNFKWFGRFNTNEVRGEALNRLYSESKIAVGDSVYSPHYWSNRVVETLGRGGFLIHQEVEGLKEEYPYLVTYKKGDVEDLLAKVDFYLTNEKEREIIRQQNFDFVKEHYTMDIKCKELLNYVKI
jgi:Glycosyl transferases group 1